MAYAQEVMGGGFSAGQASALGGGAGSFAAAGSAQGDATPITAGIATVTAADGTKGVILLSGAVGDGVWVYNNAASTLKVYPNVGAAIDVTGTGLGTVNAAHSLLTFKCALYKRVSSTQWFVVLT